MRLAPLLNASTIQLHAFFALADLDVGLVRFAGSKGAVPHRLLSFVWLALMATVAVTSHWISGNDPRIAGPFGPLRLLSIFVLLTAPLALYWRTAGYPWLCRHRDWHFYRRINRRRRIHLGARQAHACGRFRQGVKVPKLLKKRQL